MNDYLAFGLFLIALAVALVWLGTPRRPRRPRTPPRPRARREALRDALSGAWRGRKRRP